MADDRDEVAAIVDQLEAAYRRSLANLRRDLAAFLKDGTAPDPARRQDRAYAYPGLRLTYAPRGRPPTIAIFTSRWTFSMTLAASATLIELALCVPAVTMAA